MAKYIIISNQDSLVNNCGILEVGDFSCDLQYFEDSREDHSLPNNEDWKLYFLELDSDGEFKPIVCFSYNKSQYIDRKVNFNTASLLDFLKSKKESMDISKWKKNPSGSEIQMVVWVPSVKFRKWVNS